MKSVEDIACILSFVAFLPPNTMSGGRNVKDVKKSIANLIDMPYDTLEDVCKNFKEKVK